MTRPFLLKPATKDYLWGGNRLNDDFNLEIPLSPLAEAWVCSTHKDGASVLSETNEELLDVLRLNPELLGTHALSIVGNKPELPILVKLIDAKNDLSVQVHPNDDYALKHEGQRGKTEFWYVIDARPGAKLVYGFKKAVTKEQIREAVRIGKIEQYLNYVPVYKNDLFFIEAGTVHAIGAGCLIAEVQESSNITYRLYDYNRVDKTGKKRQLHIEKALEVMKLESSISPRQPMRVLKYRPGCASELLARCRYFQVERILLNTEVQRRLVHCRTGGNSFWLFVCIAGCGSITYDDAMLNFFKGDCFFVPANSNILKLHGQAQLLKVVC